MNNRRTVHCLILIAAFILTGRAAVAQQKVGGRTITEQDITYGGELDAVYSMAETGGQPSKKTHGGPDKPVTVRVMARNGMLRMTWLHGGIVSDVILTKSLTMDRCRDSKSLFNRPDPESLAGMPPLPINFESCPFLMIKPEGYYLLQAGSSWGAASESNPLPSNNFYNRSYPPVVVTASLRDGIPLIEEIRDDNGPRPPAVHRYSAHRRLGNVWFPGRIEVIDNLSVPAFTRIYTLKSFKAHVAASQFDIGSTLRTGDYIQSDDGHSKTAFLYDPTKPIGQQHAAAAARDASIVDAVANDKRQRRYNGSYLLLMVGTGLLLAWYARRGKGPKTTNGPAGG